MPYNFQMGRLFYLAAALAAAACGKVGAGAADAAIDALPDALSCSATQLACESGCADPMTDSKNCGACSNTCNSGETCAAGHCSDMVTTCAQIHSINGAAASGFYTLLDGTQLYCDMTAVKGYTSLIMAQFDSNPTGYTIVSASDLEDAGEGAAFIALYNQQGGLRLPTAFGVVNDNCCFKNDTTTTNMLFLQATYAYPAVAGVKTCTPVGGYVTTNLYQLNLLPDTMPAFATPPLPANFFTLHPATSGAGCSVANNPAIFWKVTQ
jgi:Stigma-specific protein, Stig1